MVEVITILTDKEFHIGKCVTEELKISNQAQNTK